MLWANDEACTVPGRTIFRRQPEGDFAPGQAVCFGTDPYLGSYRQETAVFTRFFSRWTWRVGGSHGSLLYETFDATFRASEALSESILHPLLAPASVDPELDVEPIRGFLAAHPRVPIAFGDVETEDNSFTRGRGIERETEERAAVAIRPAGAQAIDPGDGPREPHT